MMGNAYYDKKETVTPKGRERRYGRQLTNMIAQGCERSTRLKRIFKECGIDPEAIRTVRDLEALPVISREKLVEMELEERPYGGLSDTGAEIDRIFVSPGPVYEPHLSESDPLWARAYFAAGVRKGDVVLNAFSYHMVAAGLTFHGGLRSIGATVIPSGTSGSEIQVQLIRDLEVSVFTGTPSFLMAIIRKAEEMGHNFRKDFRLRKACFAAEPLLPALRQVFESEYGIDTYQMYGATEVGDVAFECAEKNGWHVCEEVLVEIVDPATGKKVRDGQIGEVVVTRFNDLFFLLRFGTGDLSRLINEPCRCGRTSLRLDGIAGRVGDAVKVRGLFIAPSQLRKLGDRFPDARFQLVVNRAGHEDVLTVKLAWEGSNTPPNEAFREYFRDICTVRIDRLENVASETFGPKERLIVDERSWR